MVVEGGGGGGVGGRESRMAIGTSNESRGRKNAAREREREMCDDDEFEKGFFFSGGLILGKEVRDWEVLKWFAEKKTKNEREKGVNASPNNRIHVDAERYVLSARGRGRIFSSHSGALRASYSCKYPSALKVGQSLFLSVFLSCSLATHGSTRRETFLSTGIFPSILSSYIYQVPS